MLENSCLDIVDFLGLKSEKVGNVIIPIHAFFAVLLILIAIFTTNYNALFVLIILLTLQTITYVMFRGCIITRLEKILTKNNYTVLDPLLNVVGLPVTDKNRYNITLIIIACVWIIVLLKFYAISQLH